MPSDSPVPTLASDAEEPEEDAEEPEEDAEEPEEDAEEPEEDAEEPEEDAVEPEETGAWAGLAWAVLASLLTGGTPKRVRPT